VRPAGSSSRAARGFLALVVVCGAVVVGVVRPPASPASAATVTLGVIQAQMLNHLGVDHGTTDNCIRYAPAGTATSSALVSSPAEAQTAHGRPGQTVSTCPGSLNTGSQSAVGFRPSAQTTVEDGQQFLIGRMVHYNNPVYANDRYFKGTVNTVLSGFTTPNTLAFNWTLDETPNSGGGCCNDLITFTNQISDTVLTQGGLRFRLVINGFVPVATATTCPGTATGSPVNEFSTVEGTQTHACLYATVAQVRTLTIIKTVTGAAPTKTFNYTSTSSLAGSPWSNSSFSLTAGGTVTRDLTSGNTVTVTEVDPNDDRWALSSLNCTQIGAGGATEQVPGATFNVAARQVVLNDVPPPPNLANPDIRCTFTNAYTPKSTLTLVKRVDSGDAPPSA